jgi:hypothetical protein
MTQEKKSDLTYLILFAVISCLIIINGIDIVKFATLNGATFLLVILLGVVYCFGTIIFFHILFNFFVKKSQ